jgi:RNA polymerase sigma-70 factor (ECF subfamily)
MAIAASRERSRRHRPRDWLRHSDFRIFRAQVYGSRMNEREVEEAYRAYAPHVYARCVRIIRNREAARDVTQEVFLRCFRDRSSLRPGRELLAWLYRVATNLCLNLLRASKVRAVAPEEHAGTETATEAVMTPAAGRQELRELLAGLDARTQAIAIHVYVDGMTQTEAAKVAGVTDRTVRNSLTRFLKHARKVLGLAEEEDCHGAVSVRART